MKANSSQPTYLDHNATTPIDHLVSEAVLPYLEEHYGNPSTNYTYGQRAKRAVEHARAQVAALIKSAATEVVFTSGGSESDNHAVVGTALDNAAKGKHIITLGIEHPAIINTCRYLEANLGFRDTHLPVDQHGLVTAAQVRRAVTAETTLITVMHANNEVGTIEPIEEIGQVAREHGIIFHTDAAQSCGKTPVDVSRLTVDLLTISGHKLYAPKGIGALYVRNGIAVDPLIHGASQEQGRRPAPRTCPIWWVWGRPVNSPCMTLKNVARGQQSEGPSPPAHLGSPGQ